VEKTTGPKRRRGKEERADRRKVDPMERQGAKGWGQNREVKCFL